MSLDSLVLERPLVASPNQTMRAIQVSRKKLYELINSGELQSYTESKSRRITIKSINEYVERRLASEAIGRGSRRLRLNRKIKSMSAVKGRGPVGLLRS